MARPIGATDGAASFVDSGSSGGGPQADRLPMQMSKIAVAAAVLVPLVSGGVVSGSRPGGDEGWERMTEWVRRAESAWEQRSFERAPIWGTATDGEAFEAYAEAIAATTALGREDEVLLRRLRLHPDQVEAAEAESFALRWQRPLASMSTGAHRRSARPPVDWRRGASGSPSRLLVYRDLVNAATIEVRRRLARGERRAAVELSLDAATFGTDLVRSPMLIDQMVACALIAIAAGEAWSDEDLRRLDPESLRMLAEGLARIDQRFPLTVDWRGESLLLAGALMRAGEGEGEGEELSGYAAASARTPEDGGSERWAVAGAVLQQVALWERLRQSAAAPWQVREQELERLTSDAAVQQNPVMKTSLPIFRSAELSLRVTAAAVRLLRLAVALHAGQEPVALLDPLGDGPLRVVQRADGSTLLRSAGWTSGRTNVLERVLRPR